MIHLINGDSTLGTLRETALPGDKFSIDDILMEGPIIDGLGTERAWNLRADYLERHFAIAKADYLSGYAKRDRLLNDALSSDEIVLWFEFDLFCQANLLYFMDWFAAHDLFRARLTWICPASFPGREHFRGLGELHSHELESLFPTRSEVTIEQKRLARLGWAAYGSDDPRTIERFLQLDTTALPLLAPALRAHLERFPSTANGLGVAARKALEILAEGSIAFHHLFPRLSAQPEMFVQGIGDSQLRHELHVLASGPSPLIHNNGDNGENIQLTPAGRDVVANRADAIQLNGIDAWYGGAHLTAQNHWRWDWQQSKLTRG